MMLVVMKPTLNDCISMGIVQGQMNSYMKWSISHYIMLILFYYISLNNTETNYIKLVYVLGKYITLFGTY